MLTFDDLDIIRKPKLRIVTRRQMRQKLNLERRLRKKDKLIKLNIFKNLYFKNVTKSIIKSEHIYTIHIKNFVYYLLDKLYLKNKYLYFIYFYYKYKIITNINNSLSYIEYLSQDFLLYTLIWPKINLEYFFFKNDFFQKISMVKKKHIDFESKFNNNLLDLKNKFYKFYINITKSFNFTNSILVLFFHYLKEIQIELLKKVNSLNFEKIKSVDKLSIKEKLNLVYEELNDYDFTIDYKSYTKYIDLLENKPIILLDDRNKILNEIYLEELIFDWTNINKTPLCYINIVNYKEKLLKLSLQSFEIDFHLKLANIHNINLKHLNIPLNYINFNLKKKKKKEDHIDSIYTNIFFIKNIEESKLYADTVFLLEFLEKTCIQLIEIFLYKFKDYFKISYEELLNNLYLSIESQIDFIKFYNFIVKNIKNQIYNLSLESIIFLSEFLEFFYLICKNYNLYNKNILYFNIYKIKSVIGDVRFLDFKSFKKIFFFNNENNLIYENFIFNIYSYNINKNIKYYFNIYSFIVSTNLNIINNEDFQVFNNIKKQIILDLILSYEINKTKIFKELYIKRIYWRLVYFYYISFDIRCLYDYKRKTYSKLICDLHDEFLNSLDFVIFNFYYSTNFILQTYIAQMIYKYKYNVVFKSLYLSFVSMLNIDLLFYNINEFKSFVTKFEIQFIKKNQILFLNFLKLNLHVLYIYVYTIWRIFNIKDLFIRLKKNKSFRELNNLFILYLFSSLTVHYNHNLKIYNLLVNYINFINIYNDKKEKIINDRNIDNKNFKINKIKKNKSKLLL